jgi:hypothetical protein
LGGGTAGAGSDFGGTSDVGESVGGVGERTLGDRAAGGGTLGSGAEALDGTATDEPLGGGLLMGYSGRLERKPSEQLCRKLSRGEVERMLVE